MHAQPSPGIGGEPTRPTRGRFGVRGLGSDFPRTPNPEPRTVFPRSAGSSAGISGRVRAPRASTVPRFAASVSPADSSASTPCGAGYDNRRHASCDGDSLRHPSYLAPPGQELAPSPRELPQRRRLPGFTGPVTLHHSGYEPHSLVSAKHSSENPPASSRLQ